MCESIASNPIASFIKKQIHFCAGVVLMVSGIVLFIFALSCPFGVAYFGVALFIWIGAYVLTIVDSYMLFRISRASIEARNISSEGLEEQLISDAPAGEKGISTNGVEEDQRIEDA